MSDSLELPSSFWALPNSITSDETLQVTYQLLTSRLRSEFHDVPGFTTLDLMLIERICALYILARSKEMTNSFAHDRAHKEFLALWDGMSDRLRRMKKDASDAERVRDEVLAKVEKVMHAVFASMSPDLASNLRTQFADAFENADL